jgi:AraC-like DNA-binding protein
MLFRFPPAVHEIKDHSFLRSDTEVFAKLKIEPKAGKRTVFITEHTLIFVISGTKLLHFSDETLRVTANNAFLLKKGIYVMAEYLDDGVDFEALLIFLPERILKSVLPQSGKYQQPEKSVPCAVFPASPLMQDFKSQFRQYFNHPYFDYQQLIPLKQREILTLILSSNYRNKALGFINAAISRTIQDMHAVVQENILQPITVSELAALCNRSLAAFKRDFQRQYQSPPRVYINKQRLIHARMLLLNTSKSVSEIANDCAFESTSYFIRVFKKEFGVTPQAIRANCAIH